MLLVASYLTLCVADHQGAEVMALAYAALMFTVAGMNLAGTFRR